MHCFPLRPGCWLGFHCSVPGLRHPRRVLGKCVGVGGLQPTTNSGELTCQLDEVIPAFQALNIPILSPSTALTVRGDIPPLGFPPVLGVKYKEHVFASRCR